MLDSDTFRVRRVPFKHVSLYLDHLYDRSVLNLPGELLITALKGDKADANLGTRWSVETMAEKEGQGMANIINGTEAGPAVGRGGNVDSALPSCDVLEFTEAGCSKGPPTAAHEDESTAADHVHRKCIVPARGSLARDYALETGVGGKAVGDGVEPNIAVQGSADHAVAGEQDGGAGINAATGESDERNLETINFDESKSDITSPSFSTITCYSDQDEPAESRR